MSSGPAQVPGTEWGETHAKDSNARTVAAILGEITPSEREKHVCES